MRNHLSRALLLAVSAAVLAVPVLPSPTISEKVLSLQSFEREEEPVFITDIELARDNGAGQYGQMVKGFRRTDNPLHCVVTLSRPEDGTRVRFVWTAVDAGDKKEETIATAEVETRGREIVADGAVSLPREWPAGRYRVQATVNKVSKRLEFTIQ